MWGRERRDLLWPGAEPRAHSHSISIYWALILAWNWASSVHPLADPISKQPHTEDTINSFSILCMKIQRLKENLIKVTQLVSAVSRVEASKANFKGSQDHTMPFFPYPGHTWLQEMSCMRQISFCALALPLPTPKELSYLTSLKSSFFICEMGIIM